MDDLISRHGAIDHLRSIIDATDIKDRYNEGFADGLEFCISHMATMPSTQLDIIRCKDCEYLCNEDGLRGMCWHINGFGTDVKDKYNSFCSWAKKERIVENLISRQQAIDSIEKHLKWTTISDYYPGIFEVVRGWLNGLPSVQPDTTTDGSNVVKKGGNDEDRTTDDLISRQQAIDALRKMQTYKLFAGDDMLLIDQAEAQTELMMLPSIQPERTCVNCGRTANNGGWYADGGTRCPIEEHYALPKDGYCHLWEKRNVTDDDYPERREE